ncbi:MAG: protein kinase [Proteobacteria bacterium]|nr:protein kinase [Pseudomonadota bacterium]
MNINTYSQKLSPNDFKRWETAVDKNQIDNAARILVEAGLISEAIEFCKTKNAPNTAIGIALANKMYDEAEILCHKTKNLPKLAEVLIQRGDLERAAEVYISLSQFSNAAMCYLRSGNTAMQCEMQIRAFEAELDLADGDLQTVTVSRSMAIYAAKTLIEYPEHRLRALETLHKAFALEDTARELMQADKFELAGCCYEAIKKYPEAVEAYLEANRTSAVFNALKRAKDDQLEIDTLRRMRETYRLAQKYASLKRYDEAIAQLKQVDSNHPDYINALELQGDIYCKIKNFSDAAICYESLLWNELPPERTCRIAYKAGYCYESIKDYSNAYKRYQRVYDINPEFHDIRSTLELIADKRRQLANPPEPSKPPQPEPSTVQQLNIGNTVIPVSFDRYKIIEEVAHGGMGIVYKATDTILMRTVALKVLSQKLKDNQVAIEYFMREARASAALQHVNIVTVYDIGCLADGSVYMAMEFVEGKTLKQIVTKTGPFPTPFLVQVAIHAAKGLQYAHDNGIIHRDVKSSNMMLAKRDKTLKILDLGLAKVVTEHDRNSTQAIGTPYYMSPEQVLGNEIDCRSDIYSLGVTLFELATGTLPFIKGDLPYKHVHEPPPLPSSINPNIDPTIEDIILKMMQKSPDDRFASCNEVISALRKIPIRTDL